MHKLRLIQFVFIHSEIPEIFYPSPHRFAVFLENFLRSEKPERKVKCVYVVVIVVWDWTTVTVAHPLIFIWHSN